MGEYVSNATKAANECELSDEAFGRLMGGFDTGDNEADHCDGDDVLIALIRRPGYTKTADMWDKLGKWYA